jgi:uncharacterized membrane protein YcaP (DUF421 family)
MEMRWPALHRLTEGEARLVIRDGNVLDDALNREGLTRQELFSMLREEGIAHTRDVHRAYLEPSGELGVIRVHDDLKQRVDGDRHEGGQSVLPQA